MSNPSAFGHYRVDARIGQGGMGDVFRAYDTRLNRPVAVKVMRATAAASHQSHRFLREARAVSALNHPNMVVVHEIGETPDGEPFIVQEFIEGTTLRALLSEPMPVERVVDVARQIARALCAAHAAGVVHRDVKPENIMIRGDGFVKVLDFGLARLTTPGPDDLVTQTNLETAVGVLLGTPAYLSPEQAGGRAAGAEADVFSFGIVLYEMLTGRRPFVAASSLGVIAAILSEQPLPVSRVNPSTPRALSDLVQAMLEKSPEQRPTGRDVEQQLALLLSADAPATASAAASAAIRSTV
nr:serine/threonine protein kinase [Acidobacteriota bacterium]